MGEIININIGKAGIKIGQKFLQSIAQQHFQNNQDKRGRSNVFFNETSIKTQQSRSFFIDLHSGPVENINLKAKNYQILQKNLFKGTGLQSDSFAVGNYLEGTQIVHQAFENVRKQVQKCDLLSGFLLINSLGGGSGGGMTSNMLSKLREYYCNYIAEEHAVLPELDSMCSPLHIYNAILAMNTLIQYTDITFFAENAAFDHRLLIQGKTKPTLDDINKVHGQNITEITAPYRFSGSLNSNQRKTCVNMVMFPRVKFMVSSFSNKNQKIHHLQNTFCDKNFSKLDFFKNYQSSYTGKFQIFTLQVNCRDNFAYESQVDSKVKLWLHTKKLSAVQWVPHNVHVSITQSPLANEPSSSMIINSRHVRQIFEQLSRNFATIFRKKAFLWNYLASGMDEMQFNQAESNLNDLVCQYVPYDGFCQQEQMYQEVIDPEW